MTIHVRVLLGTQKMHVWVF